MTDAVVPALVVAGALALMYFVCLRPMRRGHCADGGTQASTEAELDSALVRARAHLDRLRAGQPDDPGTRTAQSARSASDEG